MKIKDALNIAKQKNNSTRKLLECEILLCHILKKDRVFLHSNSDFEIGNSDFELLLQYIDKLNNNYPIEYITNKVSFYSQYFYIDEGALIPRPETELLIDYTSKMIVKNNIKKIFEIGVGSGVISIILGLMHKDLEIIAIDKYDKALEVARKNIKLKSILDSSLNSRISLVCTNLLDGINRTKNDFIVSNPPYIKNSYKIPPNLHFEPKTALFGGEKGYEILLDIINLDAKYLCCEIGYNQECLKDYLKNYDDIYFYKDYSSFVRGFIAQRF
ncbi:HemK/PrmC family methyltransferase [Helicobacter sp. MIT 99-5507]|uniref:HemK/PrmC family methyltransferase n=1 Tax=Helicobacter sp. MIT 99-5507 TaxID=152489 RepID=UPI000E1F401F|nr:HemK/PrmC family methyltransferase [Helicobacter sp. MIT 99-5507]RDU57991.1 peptide chain release factor N(5)-glutamine methyltransferase [Helicobacter sp. MIT 99-5507]